MRREERRGEKGCRRRKGRRIEDWRGDGRRGEVMGKRVRKEGKGREKNRGRGQKGRREEERR